MEAPKPTHITAQGKLAGDLSHLDQGTIDQLSTPEMQARLKQMYREQFGSGRRETRAQLMAEIRVNAAPRSFESWRPQGMSRTEFRALRRQKFRQWRKNALRQQRSQRERHLLQPEPAAGQPEADEPEPSTEPASGGQ
jgi:hypothetical protein